MNFSRLLPQHLRFLPILLFALLLVYIAYSASQPTSFSANTTSPTPSPPAQYLTYQVDSYRRVYFSSSHDMIIAQVTITASDLCDGYSPLCQFVASRFALTDGTVQAAPGGPPTRYIRNFTSRQLVSSRTLTKLQSERGQLYFTIPTTQTQGTLTYNSQIVSPQMVIPQAVER